MQRIRQMGDDLREFASAMVQWRSSLSAPYMMAVNGLFWWCVFYLTGQIQLQLLISLATIIFTWDVFVTKNPSNSLATSVIFWPVYSIFRTLGVACALFSAYCIHSQQLERACWSAYATVGLLLIAPVWKYNRITERTWTGCLHCGRVVLNALKTLINTIGETIDHLVVQPMRRLIEIVKYVVLLRWLPDLFRLVQRTWHRFVIAMAHTRDEIRTWIRLNVLNPLINTVYRIGRWLRYWVCAHWWPSLRHWLYETVVLRVIWAVNCLTSSVIYLVCGYWIRPLARFVWKQCNWAIGLAEDWVIRPMLRWMKMQLEAAGRMIREALRRLALAIRDSVIGPFCLLCLDLLQKLALVIYETTVRPVIELFKAHLQRVTDFVVLNLIGPVCETIVAHIPEKSPFCEDSETELGDLLPDEDRNGVSDDAELSEGVYSSRPQTPLEEDERELLRGLKFPSILESESSDEEFDLHVPVKTQKPHHHKQKEILHSSGSESEKRIRKPRKELCDYDEQFEILEPTLSRRRPK